MDKEVKNWVDSAHYDLETAAHLFNTGRYVYTIFMCHLSLEKILKAKVQEATGKVPPKTHNLRYLVKLGKLEIPEDIFDVVVISDDFKEMNLLKRLETIGLALAKAKIMEPIEALGYTEEEYNSEREGTFIGDEVKSKGVVVV